ncbi:hypothetical protein PIB30_085554, partial [Stylosanthes scabra]|nr:hypothetical protein [Stylosanthes scabra]
FPNPRRYIPYIGAVCGELPLRNLTMVNQDEEGVAHTDHSDDEGSRNRRPERQNNQQNQPQPDLDLKSTANEASGSGNANVISGGAHDGQQQPPYNESGNRSSAFDRLGTGGP